MTIFEDFLSRLFEHRLCKTNVYIKTLYEYGMVFASGEPNFKE